MAKTSVKARQKKRERMVAQYAEKRAALKAAGEWQALDELPKNSSKVRLKNRCQLTGRPRGYVRYFGISRVALRDMALNGKIPGLKKASW
ncbi:MAG: 30S ribosomal protein S14 [Chitinophagaceae bacterium]|nr:30S ribosomal protein S14 [Chitinophagaceae bacterium]MBN8668402.1 30S ribosomal protein S14 [Chitinophagales bacterium]MDX1956352.1 30S ribosomal protein S14 [Chitinophagaceae bacterium]OYW20592.1 MAG: 30S ribosomal protein S14 [Sphingobacteriales bacterium 12-47-4]